jgi:hypothetical protein
LLYLCACALKRYGSQARSWRALRETAFSRLKDGAPAGNVRESGPGRSPAVAPASVWKPEEMLWQIANPFQLNIDISMQYFKSCFLLHEYVNVHPETPDETLLVSNSQTMLI